MNSNYSLWYAWYQTSSAASSVWQVNIRSGNPNLPHFSKVALGVV
jgi:hypothetical protein